MGALARALLVDAQPGAERGRRVRRRAAAATGPSSRDTYFGVGPIVGLSLLLGNWRHLAVSASPELAYVWFRPAARRRPDEHDAGRCAARWRRRCTSASSACRRCRSGCSPGMGLQYESAARHARLVGGRAGRRQRLGRAVEPLREVLPLMAPRKPPPDSDLQERRELLDAAGIARTLRRMAHEIAERVPPGRAAALPGGRPDRAAPTWRTACATMLVAAGEAKPTLGAVDISLYRDDVFHGLPKPEIGPTELPEPIEGRTIVLVDDVLYTGRTIRAAMDVLADYGRPRAVKLAALVDRGRRELPIQPDFVGLARADDGARIGAGHAVRAWRARPGRATRAAGVSAFGHRHLLGIEPLSAADLVTILDLSERFLGDRRAPDQEGADAAREDGHQPVPRAVDAHAHVVRDRGQAAVGRRGQHLGLGIVDEQGRDAARHRAQPGRDVARRGRRPPRAGRRRRDAGQAAPRRRWSTRATARTSTRRRRCSTARPSARTRGKLAGLEVAICGDIRHSRVARSNIWALTKLGAHVRVAAPRTLLAPGPRRDMGAERVTSASSRRSKGPTSS